MPDRSQATSPSVLAAARALSGCRVLKVSYYGFSHWGEDWDHGLWHEATMGVELTTDAGATFLACWGDAFGHFGLELLAAPAGEIFENDPEPRDRVGGRGRALRGLVTGGTWRLHTRDGWCLGNRGVRVRRFDRPTVQPRLDTVIHWMWPVNPSAHGQSRPPPAARSTFHPVSGRALSHPSAPGWDAADDQIEGLLPKRQSGVIGNRDYRCAQRVQVLLGNRQIRRPGLGGH